LQTLSNFSDVFCNIGPENYEELRQEYKVEYQLEENQHCLMCDRETHYLELETNAFICSPECLIRLDQTLF
jgi:hypothetical protein